MIRHLLKLGSLSLLSLAIGSLPIQAVAQTTNKAAADKRAATAPKDAQGAKKASGHPFHGNLASVDKVAKTITIGKSTYQITSTTKITKAGKPATLEDGVIGEAVGGYTKPNDDGAMVATSVRFGPKPSATPSENKPAKPDNKSK
jgi:hypothetical protein